MIIPLNPDEKDPIWKLFGKVVKVIDSRSFQQELSRNGLKNIKNHQNMIKILLISSYFKLNVSDVYSQVIDKSKLLKFLNIKSIPNLKQIRRLYSRFQEKKYLELALKTLNKLQFQRIQRVNTIIFDSTSITLDLKFNGKFLSKQKLLDKDYQRCYSTNEKHYARFKMTLAIDYRTCKPLAIYNTSRMPHDSKIFDDMLFKLQKKENIKKKDR